MEHSSGIAYVCYVPHCYSLGVDLVPLRVLSVSIIGRWYSQGSHSARSFDCLSVQLRTQVCYSDRLGGLVVKASALGAEDPGFESRLRRDFSGSSHTSDLKVGTPLATLPGAWRYRVSAGTGLPGVSIL